MTFYVRDANTTTQPIASQSDSAGNLVLGHVPYIVVNGVAIPVSSTAPMPVTDSTGMPALDGSGTVTTGGVAQTLFSGVTPTNGYLVANNGSTTLYVSDVGVATNGGASVPIGVGTVFVTPPGYKPGGPVSLYGATGGQGFAARRW